MKIKYRWWFLFVCLQRYLNYFQQQGHFPLITLRLIHADVVANMRICSQEGNPSRKEPTQDQDDSLQTHLMALMKGSATLHNCSVKY